MYSIADNINFIGVDDDNLDLFEGQYPLSNGISYNSYLIDDEKIAILDAVDIRRCDEWLFSLSEALGDRSPDYLIVQHMEPDHTGSIGAVIAKYPDVKIICTALAVNMLSKYFEDIDFNQRIITVRDGETFSLGSTELNFVTAPMVHWPEVMMTYDRTHGILFSADAFGSFAMSGASIDDAWDSEARRYYTNIVGRFGANVKQLMAKVLKYNINILAPLHGPILSGNLSHYISLYDKWSQYKPESDGVLIAYASIYGGTAEAARIIGDELRNKNIKDMILMDLCRHDVSYAVAEAFRMQHLILCSVTYDGCVFPAMQSFLHHIQNKRLKDRKVALVENGSWAPIAAQLMTKELNKMEKMTIVRPTLTLHSRLHKDDITTIRAMVDSLLSTNP